MNVNAGSKSTSLAYLCLTSCLFLLSPFVLHAQKAIPGLADKRIHDDAHVLSGMTVTNLEHSLKLYEDSTSNQIAILIVQSLEGDALEAYSLKVAESWRLGQKSKDNGVLLFIAVDDHKLRIEVGQGLEGVLTDAQSNRIIRKEITPQLRKRDYDRGVINGVNAIIQAIGSEYSPSDDDVNNNILLSFQEQIWIGLFLFITLGGFTFIALFAESPRGWGLYFFLIPFYGSFPFLIFGVHLGLIVLGTYATLTPILKVIIANTEWGKAKIKKMGRFNTTGSGSSFSSRGSSRSSSSSSFSGGGGSFGGGGSSGSW